MSMDLPTLATPYPLAHRLSLKQFHVIVIGTGGTGGYIAQALGRLHYGLNQQPNAPGLHVTLVDGDRVEAANLLRQHFLPQDIGRVKSTVLAERFGQIYGLGWDAVPDYLNTPDDLLALSPARWDTRDVWIGAVDNHATRQILHSAFMQMRDVVYIDCGNDATDPDEPQTSGYSGQAVVGVRDNGTTVLDPVGLVYPDVLTDTDSHHPAHSCGVQAVLEPQRLITNQWSALVGLSLLNTLMATQTVRVHQITFDALRGLMRPIPVDGAAASPSTE